MSLSPRPSSTWLTIFPSSSSFNLLVLYILSCTSPSRPVFFVGPRNSRARPPRCTRIQSARADAACMRVLATCALHFLLGTLLWDARTVLFTVPLAGFSPSIEKNSSIEDSRRVRTFRISPLHLARADPMKISAVESSKSGSPWIRQVWKATCEKCMRDIEHNRRHKLDFRSGRLTRRV